jgi:hypothetical protein
MADFLRHNVGRIARLLSSMRAKYVPALSMSIGDVMTVTFLGETGIYDAQDQTIRFVGFAGNQHMRFYITKDALLRVTKKTDGGPADLVRLFAEFRHQIEAIAAAKFKAQQAAGKGALARDIVIGASDVGVHRASDE